MRNHKLQETPISMLCEGSEKKNYYRPFFWTDELERTDVYASGYIDGLMKRDEFSNFEQSILKSGTCSTLRDEGTQTISRFSKFRTKLKSLFKDC